jgi:hypothetical protein
LTPPGKWSNVGERAAWGSAESNQEGRMSGYMVTTDNGTGHRNFYMVNVNDCEGACAAVNKLMGMSNAQSLAPIPDETITQYKLAPGQAWLCTTTNAAGEVTHSELSARS